MQMNDQKNLGQDCVVELKTIQVKPDEILGIFKKYNLTTDKVAAVICRDNVVEVAYTPGFTVETKAHMRRPDRTAQAMGSNIPVEEYVFFETVDDRQVPYLDKLVRQLTMLQDRHGKPGSDVYFVGFGRERFVQNVLTPDNRIIRLTNVDGTGISSIRYDRINRRLVGILRTDKRGDMIVNLDFETVRKNPLALTDITQWKLLGTVENIGIFSLSRPKIFGRNIRFVVNTADNTARLLTIKYEDGRYLLEWGQTFETSEIQIGMLSGHDWLVGYNVTGDDIWINVNEIKHNHPVAAYLA